MLRTLIAGATIAFLSPVAVQAQDTTQPAPPAAGPAQPAAPAAALDAEFASYDADKSGQLDQSEFSSWFLAKAQAQLASQGKTATQEQLSAAVTTAFAAADGDKSQAVSKEELTRYLAG